MRRKPLMKMIRNLGLRDKLWGKKRIFALFHLTWALFERDCYSICLPWDTRCKQSSSLGFLIFHFLKLICDILYDMLRTSVFYQWRTTFVPAHGLLLMPFNHNFWCMTLACLMATLFAMIFLGVTVKSLKLANNHKKKRRFSIGSTLIDTIGIIVCQGKRIACCIIISNDMGY